MDLIKRDLKIDERIYSVRGRQVMIDRDLAELYGVETKALNQAVKRNIERFPPSFMFRLKQEEFMELVTICDRFEKLKHSSNMPHAFTEQGGPCFHLYYEVRPPYLSAYVSWSHL